MNNFTDMLWESISGNLFPALMEHPFIRGLTSGDLDERAFRYYVRQDSAYLETYGRGLALLAAKSEVPGDFMMFCEHARTTVIVEEALHREFLAQWRDDKAPPAWNQMAPNGLLYTSYLMRVAYERPYYEGVAAYLPCYWIYQRVGQSLEEKGSPNPLYQKWIDTYAGEEFGTVVRQILAVVNRISEPLSAIQRDQMLSHFKRTSELEYLFWEMAYQLQSWPFESLENQ